MTVRQNHDSDDISILNISILKSIFQNLYYVVQVYVSTLVSIQFLSLFFSQILLSPFFFRSVANFQQESTMTKMPPNSNRQPRDTSFFFLLYRIDDNDDTFKFCSNRRWQRYLYAIYIIALILNYTCCLRIYMCSHFQ